MALFHSDHLSTQQQKAVSDIESILDDVNNHTLKSVDELADRFQLVVNAVPFADHIPQVAGYSATYAFPGGPDTVTLRVRGNFFDIGKTEFDPVLDVGGQLVKHTVKTTTLLEFAVPKAAILGEGKRVEYSSGTLRIPYSHSCFVVGTCCEVATFSVPFVSLPANPGTVEFAFSRQAPQHQTSTAKTQTFVWDSSQDDGDLVQCAPVEPGWKVDTSTVRATLTFREGDEANDWFDLGNVSTLTAACWHFKTLHKRFGTSGKLNAFYTYTRFRDTLVGQTRSVDVPLTWGMQRSVTFDPTESWKLTYRRFDGSIIELTSASSADPYLQVSTAGASISLQTVP